MNALKNNKLVAIPDHLIIRNVGDILNQDKKSDELSERETSIQHRIGYSLHTLHQYSQALKQVRQLQLQQPYPQQEKYSYAM